jgi:predicted Holliday junction resolvase-like endonuclease
MNEILQTPILVWLLVAALLFVATKIAFILGRRESQRVALKYQRPILAGKISEQIAPFFPDFPEDLKFSEARFIGKPVDFIIFKGIDDDNINELVFVEVKSGKSQLTARERSLKDVIQAKKVSWYEYRVNQEITDLE